MPIDAMIGNRKELSWDDASLIDWTDVEIVPVLLSIFSLAFTSVLSNPCLLYTSDAADDSLRVDLGSRRILKK